MKNSLSSLFYRLRGSSSQARTIHSARLSGGGLIISLIASVSISAVAIASHDSPEEIEYQVKKVGRLNIADAPASASNDSNSFDAENAYTTKCGSCHAAGVLAAPILGDAGQWSVRIAQGMDTLYAHAIEGFNNMPPKGGAMDLSDEQIQAIVDYMVSSSQ